MSGRRRGQPAEKQAETARPQGLRALRTANEVREAVAAWRARGESVGLVPTMGAFHEGHLSLVRSAREACERVIVSIFVNPAQFGPDEDYEVYPRDEARDRRELEAVGVDVVFAPEVAEMYPPGFATSVRVRGLTEGLCGAFRPHHFEGVTTVVTKLLVQVLPDAAYFGEKDYQQLQVIRRLARDLDLPVRIEAVATVREADGLALSSRNVYLSAAERRIAPRLYQTLKSLAERLAGAARVDAETIAREVEIAEERLLAAGFARIDYLEVRDAETLEPASSLDRPARALAAAWLGSTHLIDNYPVPPVA
ncbi:MAG: pantoate--beta-alanine ligase [Alphaproteobacteria bacterium]